MLTRARWAGRYPSAGYLFAWYGGLYPAGYSLLAPYLLAAFGTLAWLLPTAVGANADRLGELLAGPVLIGLAEPGMAQAVAGVFLEGHQDLAGRS